MDRALTVDVAWTLVLTVLVLHDFLAPSQREACTAALTVGLGVVVAVPGVYGCAHRAGVLGTQAGQGLALATLVRRSPPCRRVGLGIALLTTLALLLILRTVYAAALLAGIVALLAVWPESELAYVVVGGGVTGVVLQLLRTCDRGGTTWAWAMLVPAGARLAGVAVPGLSRGTVEGAAAAAQLAGAAAVIRVALGAAGR